MKQILLTTTYFILSFCLFAHDIQPAQWTKGKGTNERPYLIETTEHLYYLSQQVAMGNSFENVCFILSDNVDLRGNKDNQWTPIGNFTHPFRGHFNGNQFEIRNLYIDNRLSDYTGFFGCVHSGIIRNLGISDNSFVSGKNYTGSVVGYQTGGEIYNCCNKASVQGENNVGGIVGYQYGTSVYACHNMGDVKGKWHVGGIVGMGYANTSIANCCNTGRLQGQNHVGGIAGSLDGYKYKATMKNCYQESIFDKIGLTGTGIQLEASDCYYAKVDGMRPCNFGTPVSNNEMLSVFFCAKLDQNQKIWIQDQPPYVNSGYPVLRSVKYKGVFTNEATDIAQEEAVLSANFVADNEPILSKGFEYRNENENKFTRIVINSDTFSYRLVDLSPHTRYEFKAFVITEKGTYTGRNVWFRTLFPQHNHDHDHDHHILPH
ncbi:MAG: fibronectin type III domain-containing protein [Bacteroidales bacterium]|jgi:hypothetical protein|nr:fibronectin type III domain-containing protein [Bacteroidales bacterium]